MVKNKSQEMRTSVKKWGNSAAVRIPAAVLEATHVEIDREVDIREQAGRILARRTFKVDHE